MNIRNYELEENYDCKYIINEHIEKEYLRFALNEHHKCYLHKVKICFMMRCSKLAYSVDDEY